MKRLLVASACGAILLVVGVARSDTWHFSGTQRVFALTFDDAAAVVPEPATLSLLGAVFLGAGWAVRRHRQKHQTRD